ncbi:ANTAR domain-containing protein [Amycolatopsis lurida]
MADLAVLGLTQDRDHRRVERLAERSLSTFNERAHVNQAIGMIAGTAVVDPDTARDHLAAYSARTGRSRLEVARAITDGLLSVDELTTPAR